MSEQCQIDIPLYSTFYHNRLLKHRNAVKGSDGVAVLVKKDILNAYNIIVSDKSYDGILGLTFTHRASEFIFLLYASYLPPENSPWGRYPDNFCTYDRRGVLNADADLIIICGDVNCRIGEESDFIEGVHNIVNRSCLDKLKNSHGKECLNFLKDCKFCLLNGRVTSQFDNFTSVSTKGKTVVDYLLYRTHV